jgi:hypothetical protein
LVPEFSQICMDAPISYINKMAYYWCMLYEYHVIFFKSFCLAYGTYYNADVMQIIVNLYYLGNNDKKTLQMLRTEEFFNKYFWSVAGWTCGQRAFHISLRIWLHDTICSLTPFVTSQYSPLFLWSENGTWQWHKACKQTETFLFLDVLLRHTTSSISRHNFQSLTW